MVDVDFTRLTRIALKWLWLIFLAVAVAAGTSYFASESMQPTYRTSVTLMVGDHSANPNVSPDEISTSQRLADGYAVMAQRQPILDATVKALGLQTSWWELRERVVALRVDGTQLIEIRVLDSSPSQVKAVAEEIARQLILQSPTVDYLGQLETRREFLRQQLDALQTSIQQAEVSLAEKKAALQHEASARGIFDLEDDIRGLELKLENLRTSYAGLLESYQSKGTNALTVVEPAYEPTEPISPNTKVNVLLASALGLMLVLGFLFVIEFVSRTISEAEDVTHLLALTPLGSTIAMGKVASRTESLIANHHPRSAIAECYRVLRTNLDFACVDEDTLVLLVSSPGLEEGKSTTSANLAVSFAETGRRTILVDVDFRRPAIHQFFGIANQEGLTSFFDGQSGQTTGQSAGRDNQTRRSAKMKSISLERAALESYLVPTTVPTLRVLPTGPLPANPSALLGSARMQRTIGLLREMAEVVILDCPPVLPVADTGILAAQATGVVLVVKADATRVRAALAAKEALLRAHAQILGVVLNQVQGGGLTSYHSYYSSQPIGRQAYAMNALHSLRRKLYETQIFGQLYRLFKRMIPRTEPTEASTRKAD